MIIDILSEAARIAGCRAIIQANWDEFRDIPESPDIYRIIRVPHQHIFPRCAAVVHHGGAGTTQAATIACCPSIVVEHSSDQPLWGSLLQRIGIAPRLLHRRSLTARKLAQAIKTVLNTPTMKDKAKKIGAMMQQENGVARAVELIEQYGVN
jgi:UDP:flavonoid glycosyltransferase YjiC (YdhE family)